MRKWFRSEEAVLVGLGAALFCLFAANVALMLQNPYLTVALYTPAGGIASYVISGQIYKRLRARRLDRVFGGVPEQMVQIGVDEETDERILAVTLHNGEQRLVRVPVDYDPAEDKGLTLMRAAAPELFEPGGVFEGIEP